MPGIEISETQRKREWLRGYGESLRRERELLERVAEAREARMSPSVRYGAFGGGKGHADLSAYAARMEGLFAKYWAQRRESERRRVAIEEACRGLEPSQASVILMRYVGLLLWRTIAERMGKPLRTVLWIHGRALGKIDIPDCT